MYYEGISKADSIKNIDKLHSFVKSSIEANTLSMVEWRARLTEINKHLQNFLKNYSGNKTDLLEFHIIYGKVNFVDKAFKYINHKIKDWEEIVY